MNRLTHLVVSSYDAVLVAVVIIALVVGAVVGILVCKENGDL